MTTVINVSGQSTSRKLLCILFAHIIISAAADANKLGKNFQLSFDNGSEIVNLQFFNLSNKWNLTKLFQSLSNDSKIDKWSTLDNRSTHGNRLTLDSWSNPDNWSTRGNRSTRGKRSTPGNRSTPINRSTTGNRSTPGIRRFQGNRSTPGNSSFPCLRSTIGNRSTMGNRSTLGQFKINHWITCPNKSVVYNIYGELEEFSLEAPWSLRSNAKPAKHDTEFWLTSSPNQEHPLLLDLNNATVLNKVPLNLDGKVYILVHGWNSDGEWPQLLKNELMKADRTSNVVVVRWSKALYAQAVANIRVVARQLAFFINSLQVVRNISSQSFHLVCHSLGAHLCGIAGTYSQQRYNITLARISGLDPAQWRHTTRDILTRLDPSDASFVDVIHTNVKKKAGIVKSLGMKHPIGHLDFYPNNGGTQPGCEGATPGMCSHKRAHEIFIESVKQDCQFLAIRCESYKKFLMGECWGCKPPHECSRMGFRTVPIDVPVNSKFFLLTTNSSPYCGRHYRFTFFTVGSNNPSSDEFDVKRPVPEYDNDIYEYSYQVMDSEYGLLITVPNAFQRIVSGVSYVVLGRDGELVSKVIDRFPSYVSFRRRMFAVEMLRSETLTEFCFGPTGLGNFVDRRLDNCTQTS